MPIFNTQELLDLFEYATDDELNKLMKVELDDMEARRQDELWSYVKGMIEERKEGCANDEATN